MDSSDPKPAYRLRPLNSLYYDQMIGAKVMHRGDIELGVIEIGEIIDVREYPFFVSNQSEVRMLIKWPESGEREHDAQSLVEYDYAIVERLTARSLTV